MSRARQFDEKDVLEAAQNIFWEKGYEATSTRDLTSAMGLTTASLYNAFGDKRGLYLATLDHYLTNSLRERMHRAETTFAPAEAISQFFSETIKRSIDDVRHRGCMLVNTALEARQDDPEMRGYVAAETEQMEAFFRRCVVGAQQVGTIDAALLPEEVARLLLSTVLGLRVLARVRPEPDVLLGAVRPLLSLLGLPPLTEAPR